MSAATWRWLGLGLAGLIIAGLLLQQRGALAPLRDQRDAARAEAKNVTHLRATNRALAAAQHSDAEITRLRAVQAALIRLRAEVAALQQQAASPPSPIKRPAPKSIATRDWKNAGRITPADTLQTALWAAAGGNIERLTETIRLEGPAREKAQALLNGLPENSRAYFSSPEHLVAFLTSKDIPTNGRMTVASEEKAGADETTLVVILQADRIAGTPEAGQIIARRHTLSLQHVSDGWKMTVPASAIEKYAEMLKAPVLPRK